MHNKEVYDALRAKFAAVYQTQPQIIAYAPGRIEVLGNHTDYNEGYVLSAAIDRGTFFAVRQTSGTSGRLVAGDLMQEVQFDVNTLARSEEHTWQNYVKGTLAGLAAHKPLEHGFEALFFGNVPLGSGLSSSAALEMSSGLALARLYGVELDPLTLAKIGQRAEHEYAGCKCGLLDQITSLGGVAGALLSTDFRSLTYASVPLVAGFSFLMCNTHAKHALVDGAYNRLRAACEAATRHFQQVLRQPVKALRDVSMAQWVLYQEGLEPEIAQRAAHPIGENERVIRGIQELHAEEMRAFGALMFDSHESSRRLFGNSCEELDFVVDTARDLPAVYGARLSGGGFGGSVVLLCPLTEVEAVTRALDHAYEARFGQRADIQPVVPAAGAHVVLG